MIDIKHRYTGATICSFDKETQHEAILEAVKSRANLSCANLSGANLSGAYLSCAYLSRANLYGANLYGANLSAANLFGADLSRANLSGANLSRADLFGANLSDANLYGANLYGANLYGAKIDELTLARYSIVPEGDLIAWKKLQNNVIAKLSIPQDAQRVNAIGSRKCRASHAVVIELSNGAQSTFDSHTGKLEYKVGEVVTPDKFDDSVFVECSHGIHFFLTKIEAENY